MSKGRCPVVLIGVAEVWMGIDWTYPGADAPRCQPWCDSNWFSWSRGDRAAVRQVMQSARDGTDKVADNTEVPRL